VKIFVWRGDGVLQDWTSGMIVALAHDVEEAREVVLTEYRKNYTTEYRRTITLDDLPGIETEPEVFGIDGPLGFFVHGGA
jgi:hypothetical protein